MFSPLIFASLVVGGILTISGAFICIKWYAFWRRNYREELLTDGPYSRVRHPFYAGFIALAIGLAVLIPLMETFMLATFSIACILFYIRREEEFLLDRYGKAYRDYMQHVRWRLIPKVY